MLVSGKRVVVVGGNGLIGKAIVKALVANKAKVTIADITYHANAKVNYIKFDVADNSAYYEKLFKERVDVFINASYPKTQLWATEVGELSETIFKNNIDLHLNSYCLLSRFAAKNMLKRGIKGSIINFASIYGIVAPDKAIYKSTGMVFPSAYCAIKAGIISYTRYIASVYGEFGIRANCISPGGVFDKQPKEFVKNYLAKVPLGRMAKPEDIVGAVLFLASDSSSYVTGTNIIVDGGWTCI